MTLVIVSAKTSTDIENSINKVLLEFSQWCYKNSLVLNADKTVCLLFHKKKILPQVKCILNGSKIKVATCCTFLGIALDNQLSWSFHLDRVCKKLNSAYYAIRNLKQTLTTEQLLKLYYALVYPHLSYNIIVWGQCGDIHRIFVLQKRILRLIFNLKYRESCRTTFVNNNILTVICIYLYKILVNVKKNRDEYTNNSMIHDHNTRQLSQIHVYKYKSSFYSKSPKCAGPILFNKLPNRLQEIKNQKLFCKHLKIYLIENCFYDMPEFLNL